jgi:hypothetical protein
VLEIIDIKKLSSVDSVAKIFQALGRLLLEPVAEKLLLDFRTNGMIMIFIFQSPFWMMLDMALSLVWNIIHFSFDI